MPDDAAPAVTPFRLLVVPGANPAKWLRVWSERLPDVPLVLVQSEAAAQGDALRAADADAGLVRLPVDRDVLSAIPLYTETSVVVVPKDHVVTAADEVTAADLVDETLLVPADDVLAWDALPGTPPLVGQPLTTAAAVELVAAGVGVLVVPQSLARLHHRRDVTYRPVTDAPTSTVALAWVTDRHDDRVEEMIGIVRGRTANSSRGRAGAAEAAAGGPTRGGAGSSDGGKGSTDTSSAGKSSAGKSSAGRSSTDKAGTGKAGTSKSGAPRGTTADRAAAAARRRAGAPDGGTRKGRGGRPR
ncbi:LysR substrate-binding domain-containing protein [Cellulomonas sp. NS3]|uniref:LysR substrate-binding domain-containing protein n=1 Tax=Cellulomonas sp. NS3 TaxID=2973977 RepID=UPI0021636AC7|nr:LysR substrate-binding domain-containing protein [Cellulomonas sp. NS3]